MQKSKKFSPHGALSLIATASLLVVATSQFGIIRAIGADKPKASARASAPSAARILLFPADQSYGGIVVLNAYTDNLANVEKSNSSGNLKAQGKISVPAGKTVVYFPNHNFYRNPHGLDRLPTDAIDYVHMRYMSMEDSDDDLGDPALVYLTRFASIRCFDLNKAEVTDKALAALDHCKKLERLDLFAADIDCTFLAALKDMKALRDIDISHTNVKGANLKYLARMNNLTKLTANFVRLNDSDIAPLAACKKLDNLGLANSSGITDLSEKTFMSMPALTKLDLRKTRVSKGVIKRLRARGIAVLETKPEHTIDSYTSNDAVNIFAPVSRDRNF